MIGQTMCISSHLQSPLNLIQTRRLMNEFKRELRVHTVLYALLCSDFTA